MELMICRTEEPSEMDLLMKRMFIPFKEVETKPEKQTVTSELIDEIINASKPPEHVTGKQPEEIQCAADIQTRLQSMLGVDLAGYFNVNVSIRERDSIVRLLFKGTALGIGANVSVLRATQDALLGGLVPSLKQLQRDLNRILEILPWTGGK
jgi:hypothetical protein